VNRESTAAAIELPARQPVPVPSGQILLALTDLLLQYIRTLFDRIFLMWKFFPFQLIRRTVGRIFVLDRLKNPQLTLFLLR